LQKAGFFLQPFLPGAFIAPALTFNESGPPVHLRKTSIKSSQFRRISPLKSHFFCQLCENKAKKDLFFELFWLENSIPHSFVDSSWNFSPPHPACHRHRPNPENAWICLNMAFIVAFLPYRGCEDIAK
jgi:hypothetical protein